MKSIKFISVFFAILILSGCMGGQPTYNKDYSNIKVFIRDLAVPQEYQANEIVKQLNNSNNKVETFIQLANQYSKPSNGIWIDSNAMAPIFGNVLFEMNEGSITQRPIRNDKGYHVILLEKKITKQQFAQLQSNSHQKDLERIASYEIDYLKEHNRLLKKSPKHKETFIQPYNKKQPCKIWVGYAEGYAFFEEDSYKISWDGKCKNGFASGLGREIESADMLDKWSIAIYKKGKATYYIRKDNLSNVLYEGIQKSESKYNSFTAVITVIKEKSNDIDIMTISQVKDGKNNIKLKSTTSPFWNGTYSYVKEYLNFGYVYWSNQDNDMNNKIDFEFTIQKMGKEKHGWAIAKPKNADIVTGEFINNQFNRMTLPKSYNQKADKILREIKEASNKAFQAQEQAQKVKKQYLKRVCKDNVKVSFMDNNEYKEICSNKKELALMKKINKKLNKLSEEKIARLEKQRFNEQQQKEEKHRQEMLSMERNRLSEIQRHNMAAEAQADADHSQRAWKNLNDQINNMTPKTYNVNHSGFINVY